MRVARRKKKDINDIYDGPLKDRRFGLRVDDDIEVLFMAGDIPKKLEGRLLRQTASYLELLDGDGVYHIIHNDWVVMVTLKRHNRPHPSEDPELMKKKSQKKDTKKEIRKDEPSPQYA